MIKTIPLYKAKANLSALIDQALNGEEIIISRDKVPIIKLMPISSKPKGRNFGSLKGRATIGPEFFSPLTEDELSSWE